jgi:hypothetical protein
MGLFDLLMDNRSVWDRPGIMGGTLIDLDFDGTPEFLVLNGSDIYDWGWLLGQSITIYRIIGDELTEIAELTANVFTGAETPSRHISLYTDEFGNRSWALPYETVNGNVTESRMSLFDFTGGEISEFVKFASIRIGDNWNSIDYFIDEREAYLTADEIRAYNEAYARYEIELEWYQRDREDYLANSVQEFYTWEGLGGDQTVLPPMGAGFFSDSTLYTDAGNKWWAMKYDFERSLIPTSYKLDPNRFWSWQTDTDDAEGKHWHEVGSPEVYDSLVRLVNAYVTNDTDYLLDPWAYSLGAMAKPVVYLYPEEATDVEVLVTFPRGGHFTAVYPDYGDGWRVTAHPDGTLINHADNREYQYLYWAGRSTANWDFSRGFVVKGSDTVAFFQEKLAYLGLIPREYNEFIVYYLPLMQNNAYNLVTFQTAVYEDNVHMQITPEPDSILRIFMVFMPLEEPVNIPEQQLERFERTGFAAIEWGGTEVAAY